MKHLDENTSALVVIDMQNGIVAGERAPYSGEEVKKKVLQLADKAEKEGIFTVFVRVSTTDGKDIRVPAKEGKTPDMTQNPVGWDTYIKELDRFKEAHRLTKRQWGAFYGTDLDLQLRRRGIKTIILCGISTNIGVETTAREAYQHDYELFFVEDAMTASSQVEHEHSFKYIFSRLGKTMTTEEIIK